MGFIFLINPIFFVDKCIFKVHNKLNTGENTNKETENGKINNEKSMGNQKRSS